MRIGFYAPLKPIGHPVPSGDRQVARLLVAALEKAGHTIDIMSSFRSRDDLSRPGRLARMRRLGAGLADRVARRLQQPDRQRPDQQRPDQSAVPDVWITYHLYYKAPDWLGPPVCRRLGIPYIVAEASHAAKRATGPYAANHRDVAAALALAAGVIGLNSLDKAGVIAAMPDPARYRSILPFLDTTPFAATAADRPAARTRMAARFNLDPTRPWLLAVAMMRPGDKQASYRLLAAAVARLADRPWQLLLVGDGPAWPDIEASFAAALGDQAADRIRHAGRLPPDSLRTLYAAADLFVWPALREAYGMALLEAQASGLPAVAGRSGGVGDILRHGDTGLLVTAGDADRFAAAIADLLHDPARRHAMAARARAVTAAEHDLPAASRTLDRILRDVVAARHRDAPTPSDPT